MLGRTVLVLDIIAIVRCPFVCVLDWETMGGAYWPSNAYLSGLDDEKWTVWIKQQQQQRWHSRKNWQNKTNEKKRPCTQWPADDLICAADFRRRFSTRFICKIAFNLGDATILSIFFIFLHFRCFQPHISHFHLLKRKRMKIIVQYNIVLYIQQRHSIHMLGWKTNSFNEHTHGFEIQNVISWYMLCTCKQCLEVYNGRSIHSLGISNLSLIFRYLDITHFAISILTKG